MDLLPPLRDELTDLAVRRQQSRDSLVFGTTTLEGLPERLTPHSLRRTFASLLVALGEDPGYVMDQLGHERTSSRCRSTGGR